MNPIHVTIIGGGITGLATAYFLQQAAAHLPLEYALLEKSGRWGGKILTEQIPAAEKHPFVIEAGPDSFITQKPWAWQLAQQLGLNEELLPTNSANQRTFVLHKGRATPLPEGVMLIVPTKIGPFARSPLISPWGKLRMGLDLVLPARRDEEDETLADFVRRRLGAEALDKIAEPLLSGIYNADAEQQSLLATFPRFRQIEAQYGSLIKGMLAARSARQPRPSPANGSRPPSMFVSFQKGMGTLVSTLLSQLRGDCRLDAGVSQIERDGSGYRVALTDGRGLRTDAVVLAVPAFTAARLLQSLAPEAAQLLHAIRYVSTGTISLAFRRADVRHSLQGFGMVIPRTEKRPFNAITWTSSKFSHRAPDDHLLVRLFFGGSRTPATMDWDDGRLLAGALIELDHTMGLQATPVLHRTYRWWRSNPQYDVGHLQRVAAIEAGLPPLMYVSGSPYRGVGIPDCTHQAQQTVQRLLQQLPIEEVERVPV